MHHEVSNNYQLEQLPNGSSPNQNSAKVSSHKNTEDLSCSSGDTKNVENSQSIKNPKNVDNMEVLESVEKETSSYEDSTSLWKASSRRCSSDGAF
ncbi:hypothetical protein CEXT_453831 [Caerostris extrusa]|uniref:Uncharacterized protein n=1 Tax=Caerostris extrusa TaxID=172846 RepID=A0AAV4RAJ5_CAEEX|nr:hypothetical protein CEXT_453831 [Caerostris extrusa]